MATRKQNAFFDAWTVYDQILDHNYMFHNELFKDLQDFLICRFASNSLTILDLGCGSARHLGHVLTQIPVEHYCGYDLSETALKHARLNLSGLGCPVELYQDDLLTGLQKQKKKYDVVFSSFACHHLNEEEKSHFFRIANQCLKQEGVMVLIDVVRAEDESLNIYLARYCDWLKSNWSAIQPEALEATCEHITENDRPERVSDLLSKATDAGFQKSGTISCYQRHAIMCLERKEVTSLSN